MICCLQLHTVHILDILNIHVFAQKIQEFAMNAEATPSEWIKHLAQFGTDGIQVAVSTVLSADEQQVLAESLLKVSKVLTKSPVKIKKRKASKALPTSIEIFSTNVLPQIKTKLDEHERNDMPGGVIVQLSMDFAKDFNSMTMEQLKAEHRGSLLQEQHITLLDLCVRFYRGLLYIEAYKHATLHTPGSNCKDWFENHFRVSYNIAWRHITVALLLRRFPRLIVCGLSFNQLAKHNTNICSYLKDDTTGLQERLAVTVEISAQGRPLAIHPGEVHIPELEFKTNDPDYSCYQLEDAGESEYLDAASESMHQWLSENTSRGTLHELLSPSDATDDAVSEGVKYLGISQHVDPPMRMPDQGISGRISQHERVLRYRLPAASSQVPRGRGLARGLPALEGSPRHTTPKAQK